MENHSIKTHNLDHDEGCTLLEVVLAINYFDFDDIYQQISRLAMGSSVSAISAILD
jgi:hypothetical protein